MAKPSEGVIDELAQTLLRYIVRPGAGDAVDGIYQWWIPKLRTIHIRSDVGPHWHCSRVHARCICALVLIGKSSPLMAGPTGLIGVSPPPNHG